MDIQIGCYFTLVMIPLLNILIDSDFLERVTKYLYAVAPMILSMYLGDAYTFNVNMYVLSILVAYVCNEFRYFVQWIESKYFKDDKEKTLYAIDEIVKTINMIHINIEDTHPATISYAINTNAWNLQMSYQATPNQEYYEDVDTSEVDDE